MNTPNTPQDDADRSPDPSALSAAGGDDARPRAFDVTATTASHPEPLAADLSWHDGAPLGDGPSWPEAHPLEPAWPDDPAAQGSAAQGPGAQGPGAQQPPAPPPSPALPRDPVAQPDAAPQRDPHPPQAMPDLAFPDGPQVMLHPAMARASGAEQPAGADAPPAGEAAATVGSGPGERRGRRSPATWFMLGAAAVVLVALIAAGITLVAPRLFGQDPLGAEAGGQAPSAGAAAARGAVEDYLQALIDGDATAALDLWAPDASDPERVLLRDDVYRAAENRPTGYEVTGVDEHETGGVVDVAASITVEGAAYELAFTVENAGGADADGQSWRITSGPLQSVAIGNVTGVTTVNGIAVDLSGVAGAGSPQQDAAGFPRLPVLPGTYTFGAPADAGVLTYGDDQRVQVLPGIGPDEAIAAGTTPPLVDFAGTLSAAAEEQAIGQARDRISLCMQSDQFVPLYCPNTLIMQDPYVVAVTNIVRSWSVQPTIRFEQRGDGAVVIVEGGELRIDFEERVAEGDPWVPNTLVERSPWGPAGGIELPVSVDSTGTLVVDLSAF